MEKNSSNKLRPTYGYNATRRRRRYVHPVSYWQGIPEQAETFHVSDGKIIVLKYSNSKVQGIEIDRQL